MEKKRKIVHSGCGEESERRGEEGEKQNSSFHLTCEADCTSRCNEQKKRRGRVAAVTDVLNGKEKQVKKELLRLEEKNV